MPLRIKTDVGNQKRSVEDLVTTALTYNGASDFVDGADDPLAEKYYGISPYSYCAGDPVNLGDLDGRDTCVLSDSIAVGGLGHMAALVQHENGRWYLYSKNGAYSGNVGPLPYGKAGQNDDGGKHEDVVSADDSNSTGYDSPEDFMNSDLGARYQTFVRLDTSPEEDKAIIDGIKEELEKTYFVGGSNCARSVQNGLSNAGLDPGVPSERNIIKRKAPNNIFIQIIKNNNNRIQK